jgi:hypothetical protein
VLTLDQSALQEAMLTLEQMPSQPHVHQGSSGSYVPSYAIARKGEKESWSAPESRPEVARPPKVTLRRPGGQGRHDALDHVEDRLLPLKQTVNPLDPRTTRRSTVPVTSSPHYRSPAALGWM